MDHSTEATAAPLQKLDSAATCVRELVEANEAWQLSDRQVIAGVESAYRMVNQAHAAALMMVGEADKRGLAMEAGAPSTQAWLAASQRMRPEDAKRDVTLAAIIRNAADAVAESGALLADVEGGSVRFGLSSGDLNVEQAGRVASALAELPADAASSTRVLAERLLFDEAGVHGPAALTRLGHRILERVEPNAADRSLAELAREEREARRLRSATRFSDGRRPDTRSARQRLADAFVEAFRRVQKAGDLPSGGGDRPRAVVTISLDALREGVGCGLMVDTAEQLSITAMRVLCCDAQVIPAVLGGAGQVLDLGRARRTFDGPIRLAVIARDQGCIHPGCPRPPRWADVHHVIPWWADGGTSVDNGVLLCGFHHRLYDVGTWGIRFASDSIPECIPPTWLDSRQRPRRHERYRERAPTPC